MTSKARQQNARVNGHKVAAALAQLGSFATTYMFVDALGGKGVEGFFIAVTLEFLLVAGKQLLYTPGGHRDALGVIAVVADAGLNAGGIWPIVQHIDNTPTWAMLVQALGLDGQLRQIPTLVIALAIGYVLSIAPHRLWRAGDQ
jgi:hypothetical protein